MKISKLGYSTLALATVVGMALAGCGDSDPIDDEGQGGNNPGAGGGTSSGGGSNTGGSNTGTGGTNTTDPDFCPEDSVTPEEDEIGGDIDDHVCLTADREWLIQGILFVNDGGKLTIESGTTIRGESNTNDPAVLVVTRGGQIDAQGTADRPIVFTSEFEPGDRQPGDWGGVVILGKARNNNVEARIEGFTVSDDRLDHGGDDDADNSGTLTYARIEFAGVDLGNGDEINGLTMGSMGSGSTIHHVMVSNSLDDGFEWFGGRSDHTHLVVNNAGDDMFDTDLGYRGKLTNLFGRHIAVSSADPTGFEWDSNRDNITAAPLNDVEVENVTLCAGDLPVDSVGMMLRRGITGAITETVVVGFDIAYSHRNANWVLGAAPPVTISNSLLFGFGIQAQTRDSAFGYLADDATTHAPALAAAEEWFDDVDSNSKDDPGFTVEDCLAAAGPNAAVTGSGIGAFKASATWLDEAWVSWDED